MRVLNRAAVGGLLLIGCAGLDLAPVMAAEGGQGHAGKAPRATSPSSSPTAGSEPRTVETTPNFERWSTDTVALLREVVRLDTSNPPGNEGAVCKVLKKALARDGIQAQILEKVPGRGNLIARIDGEEAGAVLYLGHLDSVGVKGQTWTVPPFEGRIKEGHIYGRGVSDDKAMCVMGVQFLRMMKRTGKKPKKSLIVALTADEESSSEAGLAWLLKQHPALLKADFVLNEGGLPVLEGGQVRFVEVQTAEKVYLDLTLECVGPSGHSSLPLAENPIYRLSQALARLSGQTSPVEISDTTRALLEGHVKAGVPAAPVIQQLLGADRALSSRASAELCRDPHYNALLRTTFVPTMMEAGTRVNVLPSKATANINCRVLPGTDLKDFIKRLEQIVADPLVKVKFDPKDLTTSPPSPIDHPFFTALRRVAAVHFPAATVVPLISPSASDSRFLRERGIPCYGLLPFPLSRDDDDRMHGADERLPVDAIKPGLRFGYDLLQALIN